MVSVQTHHAEGTSIVEHNMNTSEQRTMVRSLQDFASWNAERKGMAVSTTRATTTAIDWILNVYWSTNETNAQAANLTTRSHAQSFATAVEKFFTGPDGQPMDPTNRLQSQSLGTYLHRFRTTVLDYGLLNELGEAKYIAQVRPAGRRRSSVAEVETPRSEAEVSELSGRSVEPLAEHWGTTPKTEPTSDGPVRSTGATVALFKDLAELRAGEFLTADEYADAKRRVLDKLIDSRL
jgi:hypothetical protein